MSLELLKAQVARSAPSSSSPNRLGRADSAARGKLRAGGKPGAAAASANEVAEPDQGAQRSQNQTCRSSQVRRLTRLPAGHVTESDADADAEAAALADAAATAAANAGLGALRTSLGPVPPPTRRSRRPQPRGSRIAENPPRRWNPTLQLAAQTQATTTPELPAADRWPPPARKGPKRADEPPPAYPDV